MEEPACPVAETQEKVPEISVEGRKDGLRKGTAAIKTDFLTTKDKFHEFLDSNGQLSKEKDQKKENAPGDNDELKATADAPEDELPAKRPRVEQQDEGKRKPFKQEGKRQRGQNKSRPHLKPTNYEDQRLCVSVQSNRTCHYGDKCKFLHDVAEYMASKPADVGASCYLYDTFGACFYGVTCRFALAHTTPDLLSIRDEARVRALEGRVPVRNSLDKGLQIRLRKHDVPFDRSAEYLHTIGKTLEDVCPPQLSGDGNQPDAPSSLQGSATEVTHEPSVPDVEAGTENNTTVKTIGPLTDADVIKLRPCEKKQVDFKDKLYLAPLTTLGNLPFRRVCKRFGADITCGEMAMCTNLLHGMQSEWALCKRHESEDLFGVQIEGCFPNTMTKCAELINNHIDVDFVDINSGCPIDLVYKKGGGCGLMMRNRKFEQIIRGMNYVLDVPLTVKIRTGIQEKHNVAHKLIPEMKKWGVSMITLHGRSREQRYTKLADWDYIDTCSSLAAPVPLFGNGDILSYEDAMKARETGVSGVMIARGALIKPWIFTEIKEARDWDISSSERFDNLRTFSNYGLEHWGSDTRGLEKTRTFLLEWLSFMCRYIPVGLLEQVPQKINDRPPYYLGRDYMESLMASQHVGDWIKISEMLLGPVPKNFNFLPKHKANAYEK